jgi:hypothetical protein
MNYKKYVITVSMAAALLSQTGFAQTVQTNQMRHEAQAGDDRGGRGEKQPGDDRGQGEKQPNDDRGHDKGKPHAA